MDEWLDGFIVQCKVPECDQSQNNNTNNITNTTNNNANPAVISY